MYEIPWRCGKILSIIVYVEKEITINKGLCVAPRTCHVSSKEVDHVNSQEEAGFKGNSSNICALVMKGGKKLFISCMRPAGREGCRPGEGSL